MTTDTIPEDTCCGQKLKQKDTWLQPKVTLKGHRPETEDLNEPAYYPAAVSKNFVKLQYFPPPKVCFILFERRGLLKKQKKNQ